MGNVMAAYITHPDTTPSPVKESEFDPNLGFVYGRKERSMYFIKIEKNRKKV